MLYSGCGMEAQRIEEMEKMLKEAQQEKARLIENRVSDMVSVVPSLHLRFHTDTMTSQLIKSLIHEELINNYFNSPVL